MERLAFLFRHANARSCCTCCMGATAPETSNERHGERGGHIDPALLQQRIAQLPALPRAAAEALAALRDEATGADECARCIGRDQALTARVAAPSQLGLLWRAGPRGQRQWRNQMLGRRTLGAALSAATLERAVQRHPLEGFGLRGLLAPRHRHPRSAAEAIARARVLDDEMGVHPAGCCTTSAAWRWPPLSARTATVLDRPRARLPWLEAERLALGTDHAAIGAAIALHWHFPRRCRQPIGRAPPTAAPAPRQHGRCDPRGRPLVHALDLAGDAHEPCPRSTRRAWQRVGDARPGDALLQPHRARRDRVVQRTRPLRGPHESVRPSPQAPGRCRHVLAPWR